jgi:uncharacterized membrane protein
MQDIEPPSAPAPISAAIILGVGIGAMIHGIVLSQLLGWQHVVSTWYPLVSGENIRINALWDGVYHILAYVVLSAGMFMLWRSAHRYDRWSFRCVSGGLLMGIGGFNLVEGITMHDILAAHHVNETAPLSEQFLWDMGFLGWGSAFLALGILLIATCESK